MPKSHEQDSSNHPDPQFAVIRCLFCLSRGEFLTIFPAVLEISPPTVGGPHPIRSRARSGLRFCRGPHGINGAYETRCRKGRGNKGRMAGRRLAVGYLQIAPGVFPVGAVTERLRGSESVTH